VTFCSRRVFWRVTPPDPGLAYSPSGRLCPPDPARNAAKHPLFVAHFIQNAQYFIVRELKPCILSDELQGFAKRWHGVRVTYLPTA
jgi:hypothetical protein